MGVNKVVYGQKTLIDLTGDTVTAAKMLSGTTAHDKTGAKVTGTIPSQAAQTITPGTSDQTIASGRYLTGTQTIKGDANLVPEHIAEGVSIFGVTGTMSGGGGGEGPDKRFAIRPINAPGSYIEFIPFKKGMTWGDFYDSLMNGYVSDLEFNNFKCKIDDYLGSPGLAHIDGMGSLIASHIYDADGNRVEFEDEIQALDYETLTPIYIAE